MEDGVWRTVGGRRIFIKEGQSLSDAMKSSGKFKEGNVKSKVKKQFDEKKKREEKLDPKAKLEREAIAEKLKEKGAKVDENGNVTLYHITTPDNYEQIMRQGKFVGNQSPIGGMAGEKIGDRSFFTYDKEWVETWRSSDDSKIAEVKVPAEYVRQGAKNEKEIYIEGTLKKQKDNIWKTDNIPTSTFYDRIAVREYKAKHNLK